MEEREEYRKRNIKLMACYFFALVLVQVLGIVYVVLFPSALGVLAMAVFLGTIWPILAYLIVSRIVLRAEREESEKA